MRFLCYTTHELDLLIAGLQSLNGDPVAAIMLDDLEALRAEEAALENSTISRLGAKGTLDPCRRPWSDA